MRREVAKLHLTTSHVSGVANVALTPEIAMKFAQAVGIISRNSGHTQRVIIGKDTRLPNYMIEAALIAGFASVGSFVRLLGPVPKPAVAQLVSSIRCDLGVMISASGESFETSGITFFDHKGDLISQEKWSAVCELLDTDLTAKLASGAEIGKAKRVDDAAGRYNSTVKDAVPNLDLAGIRIVVDCAHGAAYTVAPLVLEELGAEVFRLGCDPNGTNINRDVGISPIRDKGHEYAAREQVVRLRADAGIIFDSDGVEVLVLDRDGKPFFDSRVKGSSTTASPDDALVLALKALETMQNEKH